MSNNNNQDSHVSGISASETDNLENASTLNDDPSSAIDATIQKLVLTINVALDDMKAVEIAEMNIREISSIADMMIVASGNSSRHVKAIADTVIEKAKEAGFRPIGVEGTDIAEWILLDFGDVIIHIMLPKTREFYDLEKLWSARPSSTLPSTGSTSETPNSIDGDQNV